MLENKRYKPIALKSQRQILECYDKMRALFFL